MSGPLPLTPSPISERGDPRVDLYVVAERSVFRTDSVWLAAIEAVIGTNDSGLAVQVRMKSESPERARALAIEARSVTRGSRIPVLLNGANEEAIALGYDGVHWPEALIPPDPAKGPVRYSGPPSPKSERGLRGGVRAASVHSPEAAMRAEAAGAHFLVAGTIFDAGSKDAPGQGLDHLRAIANATSLPVLAIGGVTPKRVEACIDAGAAGVAVVTNVLLAPDIAAAVRDLREALDTARAKAGMP